MWEKRFGEKIEDRSPLAMGRGGVSGRGTGHPSDRE